MKKTFFLAKENLKDIIFELKDNYCLYGPVLTEGGDRIISSIQDDNLCLQSGPPSIPSKFPFFPQLENMMKIDEKKWEIEDYSEIPEKPVALFGIPSCDVYAIKIIDDFFNRKFKDNLYFNKRKNSFIVSYSCINPPENCFCNLTNTGPCAENHYDWLITPFEGDYIVETGSEAGEKVASSIYGLFIPATTSFKKAVKKIKENALKKMPSSDALEKAFQALNKDCPELNKLWEELGNRCQRCGGCNFNCPTCTCFDIQDKTEHSAVMRQRKWDSCLYGGFTRMAGGHNPLGTKAKRMERRFRHKLHITKAEEGYYSCTGCGRCSTVCHANIHIREVIRALASGRDYKPEID